MHARSGAVYLKLKLNAHILSIIIVRHTKFPLI
jgi:hypothetical protein